MLSILLVRIASISGRDNFLGLHLLETAIVVDLVRADRASLRKVCSHLGFARWILILDYVFAIHYLCIKLLDLFIKLCHFGVTSEAATASQHYYIILTLSCLHE